MMDASSLPPKPDRRTGEPRPPRAPLDLSWGSPEERDRERDRGKKPTPPSGQGPVLEWFQPTRRGAISAGLFIFLIGVGFLTLRDWGIGWMRVWWLWLIVLPFPLIVFLAVRADRVAAGAEWYLHNRVWVKTYELVSVKLTKAWGSDRLELRDNENREISVKLTSIQQNRELWDLVYNGILHSVCTGRAASNQLARDRLKLPGAVALAEAAAHPQRLEADQAVPTRAGSKAGRATYIVLACVMVVGGVLALGIAVVGMSNREVRGTGSGIAAMALLAALGIGLFWGYVRLKRRMER